MKLYQTIAMNTITTIMENQNKMVFYSKTSSFSLRSQIRAPRIRILQNLEVKFEGQTTSNSRKWLLCYLFNGSKYEINLLSFQCQNRILSIVKMGRQVPDVKRLRIKVSSISNARMLVVHEKTARIFCNRNSNKTVMPFIFRNINCFVIINYLFDL